MRLTSDPVSITPFTFPFQISISICGQFVMFSLCMKYVVTSTSLPNKFLWNLYHFNSSISINKWPNRTCPTSVSLGRAHLMVPHSVPLSFPVLFSVTFSFEFLTWLYGVASAFTADAFVILRPEGWGNNSLCYFPTACIFLVCRNLPVNRIVYKDQVRTAQWTHSVSVIQTSQLMLYREIMAVCSEIHTKHINTLCG